MKTNLKKGIGVCILSFAFLLAAAGSGSSTDEVKEISNVENASNSSSDVKDDSNDFSEKKDESASSGNSKKQAVTVEEKILVDQNDIKITLKGIDEGIFGTELKLLIENNSDVGLTVQTRDASVNGFMADTSLSSDVAPGKKSSSEITISSSDLENCGINTIADIEFKFHIFTTDDWENYLDSDVIRVETSAYGSFEQPVDDTGTLLFEQNGIRIIGKGLSGNDSIFGPGLIMYIENNSDKNITVQSRDTSINGFMVDDSMSEDVIAGKKAITAITFFSSSLEDNGITDIESIETSFHIYDMEAWETIFDTDPITINF